MYLRIVNPKTGRRVSIKSGLGKSILRNYLFMLSGGAASKDEKDTTTDSVCSICLEEISDSDKSREVMTTWCGHQFHTGCIDEWFTHSPLMRPPCPLCRRKIHPPTERVRIVKLETEVPGLLLALSNCVYVEPHHMLILNGWLMEVVEHYLKAEWVGGSERQWQLWRDTFVQQAMVECRKYLEQHPDLPKSKLQLLGISTLANALPDGVVTPQRGSYITDWTYTAEEVRDMMLESSISDLPDEDDMGGVEVSIPELHFRIASRELDSVRDYIPPEHGLDMSDYEEEKLRNWRNYIGELGNRLGEVSPHGDELLEEIEDHIRWSMGQLIEAMSGGGEFPPPRNTPEENRFYQLRLLSEWAPIEASRRITEEDTGGLVWNEAAVAEIRREGRYNGGDRYELEAAILDEMRYPPPS